MAVISVSIIESSEQIVAGIPKTVAITTNLPASIFYTLDGTDPTLFSNIYTGPLFLPIDLLSVTLKVLATNGVDYSPIITEMYITNILNNARLPHSATDVPPGTNIADLYPYGTNPNQPLGTYTNPGNAGINVNDPALPTTPTGFNGNNIPTGYTNQPYNLENYSIRYSTTNAVGETGKGVGNLPFDSTVENIPAPPETTSQFTQTFDPRAFVIFQDFSQENPNDPPQINRQFFNLEDPNKTRDGNQYFTTGLDTPPISGSFVRSFFNPRDNTMTYYYYDSHANKWIISKSPYKPSGNYDGNLSSVAMSGGGAGSKYVFEWLPFTRRVLF